MNNNYKAIAKKWRTKQNIKNHHFKSKTVNPHPLTINIESQQDMEVKKMTKNIKLG
jgi:hypothetical protein